MKTSTIRCLWLLIAFLMLVVTTDSWAQKSETRNLDEFTGVRAGEAITVFLKPGNKETARIEASGIDLDEIITKVIGKTLKIQLDRGNHRNIEVTVWVTYVHLEEIAVSSAATVTTESVINTRKLDVQASSAGKANLEVDVEELDIDISSAADIKITGNAGSQNVQVSSSGSYYAYDLNCEVTIVSASSAGSAKVMASKKVEAHASSAGSIRYRGNPEKVYVHSGSGGSAKKAN